jgi:threonine/homoserine/homoserine lactone efflux protein
MFPTDFFIFLQIILFLFITPGPPRVVIVSHTLNYGINKSIWTAFGDISANLCQGILVVFFIGTFLSDNPDILQALKWAGILYIIYLAYDTYTSRIRMINSRNKNLKSVFSFYRDGFLVAGLSPKSIIFFGTIFTSFIDFTSNYTVQFFILIITYISLDFLTLMIYAFAADRVSIWLKDNPKVLNTISACVLILIAIYVAASQNY